MLQRLPKSLACAHKPRTCISVKSGRSAKIRAALDPQEREQAPIPLGPSFLLMERSPNELSSLGHAP